jgi:hypothetical protein
MRYRVVLALLESRQVSGFTKIELSGSGELKIEQTGTESLTISAEDNVLPKITSEVSDNTGARPVRG